MHNIIQGCWIWVWNAFLGFWKFRVRVNYTIRHNQKTNNGLIFSSEVGGWGFFGFKTFPLLSCNSEFLCNFSEVALDSNRAWCPKPGCNTICHICASATNLNKQPVHKARAVNCPKCEKEFCSSCSSGWHPGKIFLLKNASVPKSVPKVSPIFS